MVAFEKQDVSGGRAKTVSFRERFMAWWEGLEPTPPAKGPPQPPNPRHEVHHEVRYEVAEQHWQSARLRLVQEVWGEGFSSPGGTELILNMANFFGLDPAMSVLDLGAGLGGAARTMADGFGVWVNGLEADAQLAEAGMAVSTKAGLAKRAPIQTFDPENLSGKPKSVDCVFSKEFLYRVKDKAGLLRTIESLLKSRGQFLFTDYVLAKPHGRTPSIETWIQRETGVASPWAVEDYRTALTELRLDIRVTEDITESFHKQVTGAWAAYIASFKRDGIDHEIAPVLVDEVEIWARRIQLIESGDLKVCRIHALKKNTELMLSDW